MSKHKYVRDAVREDSIEAKRRAMAKMLAKAEAAVPVVTAASGWLAQLLAGAVFVEFVFGWRGLGFLLFEALEQHDLPVVMGGVLLVSFTFVAVNAMADLTYRLLDPRAAQG